MMATGCRCFYYFSNGFRRCCFLLLLVLLAGLRGPGPAAAGVPQLPPVPDSLRQAYQAAPNPDASRLAVLLRIARVYSEPLDSAGMVAYAGAAERLARQLGDSLGVGQAVDVRGYYFQLAGDARRAAPLLRRAQRLLAAAPAATRALSLEHLGELHKSLGRMAEARSYYQQAYGLAGQASQPLLQADVMRALGEFYQRPGSFDSAVYYFVRAGRQYHRLGNVPGEVLALSSLGQVYHHENRMSEAGRYVRQAYQLLRQANGNTGMVLSTMAAVALGSDSPRVALGHYQRLLHLMQPGAYGQRYSAYNGIGVAYERLHRPDSAERYYHRAVAAIKAVGNSEAIGFQMNNLARFYYKQGRDAEATAWANRTLALNGGREHPENTPDAWEILRRLAERRGDFATAYRLLNQQHELQTKLQAQENERIAADLRVGYDTERAEQQVLLLEKDRALSRIRQQGALAALALAGLLLAGLGTWAYRRRQATRDAALRTRLAADLHDDVGGLLTQISLESALLEEGQYAPAQQQARLGRVAEASRRAARQMRDVVWSVDARNDTFASLLDQMHEYAHEVLAPTGTELSFDTDPSLKARPLRPLTRQSLYLIFKEALHNVAKHAQASEVRVSLRPAAAGLRLEVRDNGRGGPGGEPAASHGLRNMRMRAEAVGGTLHYDSAGPGFGVVALLPV